MGQEARNIARAAAVLAVLSLLSPLAGMAVEIMLAWRFGASGTVDAFRVASLLLIFGNQLFFGQLLPHVIVPLFSAYRAKGEEADGWRLAFSLGSLFGVLSLSFVIWAWCKAETVIAFLGPGLTDPGRTEALILARYFSVALGLMVWSGVMNGILYVYRIFWISPAAKILTNLFASAAIFAVGQENGVAALVGATLLGAVVEVILHGIVLVRLSRAAGLGWMTWFHLGPQEGVRKALRLSLPLIVMIGIVQWGSIVINRALSTMPPGTLADYGYAWKLLTLVGILPASFAAVIFPALAETRAQTGLAEFSRMVTRSVRMTLLLTVPPAVILFVLRSPLLKLLFLRGAMSGQHVSETAQVFGVLLIGAPAAALLGVLCKVAFSLQDTKAPALFTFFSALLLSWLVPRMSEVAGIVGVAWALNVNTWVIATGMFVYQVWRFHAVHVREIMQYLGLLLVLCGGMFLSTLAFQQLVVASAFAGMGMEILSLCMSVGLSVLLGYQFAYYLGLSESAELWGYVKWQWVRMRS